MSSSPIPSAALEFHTGIVGGWRERREAQGLSQERLARWAKVAQAYVSRLERGKTVHQAAVRRIHAALAQMEGWDRRNRAHGALQARVDAAWASAPDCELVRLLRRQLVGRAWRLLEDGDAECADRLLELLPDDVREALLHYEFETEERYPPELLRRAAE